MATHIEIAPKPCLLILLLVLCAECLQVRLVTVHSGVRETAHALDRPVPPRHVGAHLVAGGVLLAACVAGSVHPGPFGPEEATHAVVDPSSKLVLTVSPSRPGLGREAGSLVFLVQLIDRVPGSH